MPNSRRSRLWIPLLGLACALASTASARAQDGGSGSGSDPGSGSSTGTPPDHRLSESETAYAGAIMLEGGTDVEMGDVVAGSVGDPNADGVTLNARFIGNTLYAEAIDRDGNMSAMVVEFYWFESSVPRGSDFYVAVVKARTVPHLASDWVLDHDTNGPTDRFHTDRGATLYVRSETSRTLEEGGFRWDWSLPFRDYSMDAYGTIRMKADYGVGLTSNGAAQTAFQRNEHGVEVELEAQATGHLNADYNVNTNYEITLYRWDVYTRNSGSQLEWSMFLRTGDRETQNAYHEFFIAMQAAEGEAFHLDRLEVGGHIKKKVDWWFDDHRALSVALEDIVIRRPAEADRRLAGGDDAGTGRPWERDAGTGDDGYEWPRADAFGSSGTDAASSGCAVTPGSSSSGTALSVIAVVLGLALRRRTRRS